MCGIAKILIVDDDKMIHGVMKSLLSDRRFQLYHAYNGEDAFHLCHALKPSLMILDIDMPIMNGLQVLENLYSNKNINIPIIVMSGAASDHKQKQCLELGAKMFMGKPFNVSELLENINLFLLENSLQQ